MTRKSQNKEILAWLQSGKTLSPLTALELFGCMRLGGRVFELKAAGWPIITNMISRNGKRFAEYSLREKSNGS